MARTRRSPSRFPLFLGLAVALLLGPATAGAYNEAALARLKDTGRCPNCNLTWANLSGANLDGATLAGADLRGATWIDGTKCNNYSIGICRQ